MCRGTSNNNRVIGHYDDGRIALVFESDLIKIYE